MDEEWKPVIGYEDYYEVSNLGRVRSKRNKTRITDKESKVMKQKFDNRGYLRVNLHSENNKKSYLVSRMVAEAFIPNPNNYKIVGHKDDNKINNTIDNLYWTTVKENNFHNGKFDTFLEKRKEKMHKIVKALSVKIIGTNIDTGEEIRFSSMQEAQRNGFSSGKISLCCNGKRKKHKGYTWKKED